MEWSRWAQLRRQRKWTLAQASERIGVSINTLSRWEQGTQDPRGYNLQRICEVYGITEGNEEDMKRRHALQFLGTTGISLLTSGANGPLVSLWADDLLALYTRGVAACQDLYFEGHTQQVLDILPLYCNQTASLARQPSPIQAAAARLAAQAQQIACELATDREDFQAAQQAGQAAFEFAQLAGDPNLQVAALIGAANIGFHRKLSTAALHSYKRAISLFDKEVTPLLKGRTFAGLAEVYAMRKDLQGSMRAMGQAYEVYPDHPEHDPAYPCIRASRYSLYVFGDVQSRLFLGQPKEAEKALMTMERETSSAVDPLTHLDTLYYRADVKVQQGALETSSALLTEGATLAKSLGSKLYFNKLAMSYHHLQSQWPSEPLVTTLEDVFQPW